MKILCIYHSRDLDGWCSAAIVKNYYENRDQKVELLGWDYGDKIPDWNIIESSSKIVMCDISFPKEVMNELYEIWGENFVWIDHHRSALKENNLELITGIQNSEKAACELTWEYFFPNDDIPDFIWWLGMYDSFRHKGTEYELDVLQFQYGARATWTCPEDLEYPVELHTEGFAHDDRQILERGKNIYEYLCVMAKTDYEKIFEIVLDGYKFATINRERFNPINFRIDYHKDGYDGFACFHWDGIKKKWAFSLYSDNGKTDVSKIAKEQGGGGHFGAAGFITDNIEKFIGNENIR